MSTNSSLPFLCNVRIKEEQEEECSLAEQPHYLRLQSPRQQKSPVHSSVKNPLNIQLTGLGLEDTKIGELAEFSIRFPNEFFDPEEITIQLENLNTKTVRDLCYILVNKEIKVFYVLYSPGEYHIILKRKSNQFVMYVKGLENPEYIKSLRLSLAELMKRVDQQNLEQFQIYCEIKNSL